MGLQRYGFHASCLLVLLSLQTHLVTGQFPRVCADNATREDSTCCPTPPGFDVPCGGKGRGMCLRFEDAHELFWPPPTYEIRDDRINWPVAFFKYGCQCFRNFAGYMCQDCKWGYRGFNCTERHIRKRKNLLSLSKEEQRRFIDILDRSKYEMSEYVALASSEIDPVREPKFINITVYDFITYVHFYSGRSTFVNETNPCRITTSRLDFSHGASGFPTFHRLLVLVWERELQKIAKDDTFSFPYWDWVDGGTNCSVCTNDLLGECTPDGRIHHASRFSKWQTICNHASSKQCRFCDPTNFTGHIVRRPGSRPKAGRFPLESEVDFTLNLDNYDQPPYDEQAGVTFRSCFEGACPTGKLGTGMHNLVHAFFNGTLSNVPIALNDPLFLVHHTFLDKLLELWIRKFRPHTTQFPSFGAPAGHNRDAIMVPFFPRHYQRWYFTDSRGLGYDYDNFDYGKSGKTKFRESDDTTLHGPPAPPQSQHTLLVVSLGTPVIIVVILALFLLYERLTKINECIPATCRSGKALPVYSKLGETDPFLGDDDNDDDICLGSQDKKHLLNGNGHTVTDVEKI